MMDEIEIPMIDPALNPGPEDVAFDLDQALSSVLSLHSRVPENAFTAQSLGTERAGHGVLIDASGLVLTIGYLIIEAETLWLTGADGRAYPGHAMAYDQETGFGLVQLLERTELPAMALGSSAALAIDETVIIAGHGGRHAAICADVAAKREFAGYWEYLLEEAIFTVPAHPFWGGAALIDSSGALCGIGSLFVQQNPQDELIIDGNMVVPIDILPPILDELRLYGRVRKPPRPWLGMMTAESDGRLVIAGLSAGGPAEQADVAMGDLVVAVDGHQVTSLPSLFRRVWRLGEAGVAVPMTVLRGSRLVELTIRSGDRMEYLVTPKVH